MNFKGLSIPKKEVLRYLGHKNQEINGNIDRLIDETIEEAKELIAPKKVVARYRITIKDTGVYLDNTNLVLTGEDIKNHLKYSKDIYIMAVTLGSVIEKKIAYYEKIDLTKAIILDSCATTAVEEFCDYIEEDIKKIAENENMGITFRYSPGYGDLPIDIQKDFLDTLNATKVIGLTVSRHNLLMPRKSVTAIIGLIPKDKELNKRTCEVCSNYENCKFRKEGVSCGS
ncbi:methionine synthase [Clostridium sp. MSJ-8]|uniref:vitamin B12 dependent-methionine synthase activation domain-containing protein n=1 Tax=Clostridium sp. MSJ-8 TaxID=2841510 RepID=UPI001C0F1A81|nr:vitamin B12 dependent-methionine synthase activation domain-containing protein [Clostridium sp. MSJ-8]MBU5487832.1 methionine synthase [Clostridium sp. MSJ-8]